MTERPQRPITHIDDKEITVEMIRESLSQSGPGQGVLGMHLEDVYAYPFYCEWLLDRLAEATRPKPRARRKRMS